MFWYVWHCFVPSIDVSGLPVRADRLCHVRVLVDSWTPWCRTRLVGGRCEPCCFGAFDCSFWMGITAFPQFVHADLYYLITGLYCHNFPACQVRVGSRLVRPIFEMVYCILVLIA